MIEAKILDGNAYLYTPYNPKFITAIKKNWRRAVDQFGACMDDPGVCAR